MRSTGSLKALSEERLAAQRERQAISRNTWSGNVEQLGFSDPSRQEIASAASRPTLRSLIKHIGPILEFCAKRVLPSGTFVGRGSRRRARVVPPLTPVEDDSHLVNDTELLAPQKLTSFAVFKKRLEERRSSKRLLAAGGSLL
eukprot:4493877-Amphidinium_carterae.1